MKFRVHSLVIGLAICTSMFAADQPAKPRFKLVKPQTPAGVALHRQLVCAQYGERKVTLDLYAPDDGKTHPGILFIHGGGWWKGSIEHSKPLAERLAAKGYVCALVDYRLSGEAKYPAALHDCKAALRFMRANANKYHIDVDHLGVIGGSAGGHLSGLVGMTGDDQSLEGDGGSPGSPGQSTKVQACIVMAATMDLVAAYGEKTGEHAVAFFGGTCAEKPDIYKQASPITHVEAHDPPTLFIEAEHDTQKIGRPEMQQKLRALDIETGAVTLPGAPHPFWMSQPWLDQTADLAAEFFGKHLMR